MRGGLSVSRVHASALVALVALVQAVMQSDRRAAVSAMNLWHVSACTADMTSTAVRERGTHALLIAGGARLGHALLTSGA